MEKKINNKKHIYKIISFIIIISIWKILSIYFSPLVVPTISSVCEKLLNIFTKYELYKMILITITRLFIGVTIGIVIGMITGICMGYCRSFKGIVSPMIGLLQTIPPVSWVVLSLVWFGFNGMPAIFIVVTSTIPIIAISVCEGISNIDKNLIQMSVLYHFSNKKRFINIVLPSIMPYFKSSFKIALGNGWKIAVMGEVLTTSTGIGGMIKLARLNVEPEDIIAWSIIVAIMFYICDFICGKIIFRKEY